MDQTELCSVPALVRRAAAHDPEAIELLWEKMKPLAYSVARRYTPSSSVDLDDLLQCSFFAMLETVQNYDEDKGAFTTAFVYRIRTACATALGLRHRHVDEIACLNAPLGEDDTDTSRVDMIEDESIRPFYEAIEKEELRESVRSAVAALPQEQQSVIHWRYYRNATLQQAGDHMQKSAEQVRTLEGKALHTLRNNRVLRLLYKPPESPSPAHIAYHTGLSSFRRSGVSSVEQAILSKQGRHDPAEVSKEYVSN